VHLYPPEVTSENAAHHIRAKGPILRRCVMSDTGEKPKSVLITIAKFFGIAGMGAVEEMKALTPEDKAQLGEGIRNGTFAY